MRLHPNRDYGKKKSTKTRSGNLSQKIFTGFFPESKNHDNAKVLTKIEVQNSPVVTTKSRVLNRK